MSESAGASDASGRVRPQHGAGGADLDALLGEIAGLVKSAQGEELRWRLLLDAVISITADLSLDELLGDIVRAASTLVGSRYAALGVLGSASDKRLRTFITHGMSVEQAARIGELPSGRGVLGYLIDRPESLRLAEIAEHPMSVGFPVHHPPMHSFLGVPITIHGKVFGNLYLTEKNGAASFSEEDERVAVALAAAAGVAVENARLHEEAVRRQRWLSATAEITARLTSDTSEEDSLRLIADRARDAAGADMAWIVTGPDADQLRIRALSGIDVDPRGSRAVRLENTIAGSTIRAGVPVTVENIAAEPNASGFGVVPIEELGPVSMFPLRDADPGGGGGSEGVLALAWRHDHADAASDVNPDLPSAFAQQVALALRLARGRRERQRLALLEDRDRIARDLHDVVIQRLFAVGLGLQTIYRRTADTELSAWIDSAADEVDEAIREIRHAIFDLGVAEHAEDLVTDVRNLVDRAASSLKFRPDVVMEGPVRLGIPSAIQSDLLAVLAEALSNAWRHAGAGKVHVLVRAGPEITLRVEDDGAGIPPDVIPSGLANMRRRAEQHAGRCEIRDASPHGTVVEWTVPLPRAES